MSDIYQTPQSNLENEQSGDSYGGSLENGITGNYNFRISDILSEAWELISGAKGTIWLAILIFFAVNIGVSMVLQIIRLLLSRLIEAESFEEIFGIFEQVIISLVTNPIWIGLLIMGLRRSVKASITPSSVLNYFAYILPLFYTYLLMWLMIMIGLILFVIPGIYLIIAYTMAMPLVVEKGLKPWEALEASRKAITHRWFTFFFFDLALIIIIMISFIPVGIGLIWSVPLAIVAYGVVYRNMFGIEQVTLADND